MKHFSRPSVTFAAVLFGLSLGWIAAPPGATAQTSISHILREINPLLSHNPGYLGVLVTDVDNDSATKLKLKDTKGAVITLIDHDAPAGQKGLRVNDVVVSVNGQAIEGAQQFGHILHDLPPGQKVTLVISRDGTPQTITVQLVDRKSMERAWIPVNDGDVFTPPTTGMGILNNGGPGWSLGHVSPFGSSLKVGALVMPLDSQMAEYLNMQNGVMIKEVARKSEAANAGLKQFDVILKVGADSIQTTADWDRALHANAGKQVQVVILRDRKQLILNLQVDSKHHSQVIWTDMFPEENCTDVALLDQQFGSDLAEALRQQSHAFDSQFDRQQLDEMLRQSENQRDSFKAWSFPEFKVDPKQMEEMRQQMEQFRQSFNTDQFKIDPKQMEELQQQIHEFRKSFPQNLKKDRHQLEEFRRQLNELRELTIDQTV